MKTNVKYVVDNMGKKTFVLIPYREWEEFNEKYEQLKNKFDVFKEIKEGISEVKQARKNRKELQSLSDFLDEC